MDRINEIFKGNREWLESEKKSDPDFFTRLAVSQKPEFLWIGCSDSRLPANIITNMPPGDIFVHRNIANLVIHTDVNVLSVVYFAVKVLKVKHIIVCGHYGCGGILAAMENQSHGFLDNWLTHIRDVYHKYQAELDAISDRTQRANHLVKLNIREQVHNLAKVSFIQSSWQEGEYPQIHGIVYGMDTGELIDLDISINSIEQVKKIFQVSD